MHAKITAHGRTLFLELLTDTEVEGELSFEVVKTEADVTDYKITVLNSGQHLGISAEALALLETIPRGTPRDRVDLDWVPGTRGAEFSWTGDPRMFAVPAECLASANYQVREHLVIPNDMKVDVKEAIEADWQRRIQAQLVMNHKTTLRGYRGVQQRRRAR